MGSAFQNKTIKTQAFHVPNDLSFEALDAQLDDMRDVYQDCLFSLAAAPDVS
jgi:hypothetical protein